MFSHVCVLVSCQVSLLIVYMIYNCYQNVDRDSNILFWHNCRNEHLHSVYMKELCYVISALLHDELWLANRE